MDDELRHRLAALLFELFPPEHVVYPLVTGNQLVASYADEVDAVLAEIGRTHAIVSLGDDKAGGLLRCEYEYDVLSFE